MTLAIAPLRTATAAVCALDGADVADLERAELLALMRDAAAARKAADVLLAQASAEVERRSRVELGRAGLAAREGYRSARELIAGATGGSVAEAQRLVDAGLLLADADAGAVACVDAVADAVAAAGAGDPLPPDAPPSPVSEVRVQLARMVRDGVVGVEAASIVTRALDAVPDTDRTRDLFHAALAKLPGLAAHDVRKLVWRAQAFADPAAWERREADHYETRSVTLRDEADGMVLLTARLTPLMAAPVKAVLDAGVRRAMQDRRDDPDSDPRSAWQMRADLLTDAFRHLLDCDRPTSGVKTTVVVRMTLADLRTGDGVGEVDGVAQPVSVAALRVAAADAEVIPVVLGAAGDVLDQGRARRLFTPAQRLALVERDGGCAWCNAPPSWCDAHHIRWWDRDGGATDLVNGVLLCTRCHHRVHRDGWEIEVRAGAVRDGGPAGSGGTDAPALGTTVWFTPPADIDPTRRPRLGGRARYGLTARELSAA